jgi:pimeloyl-ACP methyl ester carboxylesterase
MSEESRERRTLVLVVRGWGSPVDLPFWKVSGGAVPESFRDLIRNTLRGARLEVPELPMGTRSKADPIRIVDQLLELVDERFREEPFDKLVLVAFSAGTVLARNFFSRAHGAQVPASRTASVETDEAAWTGLPRLDPSLAKPWADKIERIIYLAGVTRGWSLSSATPATLRFLAPMLLFLLNNSARLQGKAWSFIESFKRGAPFVVESRLLFLQVERHFREIGRQMPHTVLLLGSKDEYISPADALDLGIRKDYSYIEVPASNHTNILDVGRPAGPEAPGSRGVQGQTPEQAERTKLIKLALTAKPEELCVHAMQPDDLDDYLDEMDRPVESPEAELLSEHDVSRVVFVIHGIRDNGFWTKRVAREVKALDRQTHPGDGPCRKGRSLICAPTPSYGFFSMFDFMIPWGRRNATYWFLERYAEVRVRYPEAPISFIGHSNGTYIAARALELSPFVVFERVLFAGSVVRTTFDWRRFSGRVRSVLNLVGSRDAVVAWLPGALQGLGLGWIGIDVGGAGFNGFLQETRRDDRAESFGDSGPEVQNFRYLAGGHGVGVSEPLWRDLAAYAVRGELPQQREEDHSRPRQRKMPEALMGLVAPGIPLLAFTGLAWVAATLVDNLHGWALALAAVFLGVVINNIVRYY